MAWTGQSVDDNGRAIILFNPTTSELQSFLVKTNSGRVRVVKNSVWDTADVFVFFDSKQATGAIARSYREDDRKMPADGGQCWKTKLMMSGSSSNGEIVRTPLRSSLAIARQAHPTVTIRPARTR